MKIYAVINYWNDSNLDYGMAETYLEFCATKNVARTCVEKLVAESKRQKAYEAKLDKIFKTNRGQPYEDYKSEIDKMREMFDNGYAFEYIPEENERDVWIDDRYFPFLCLDDDELDDFELNVYRNYNDDYVDGDWLIEHYLIKEIEVIDELPDDNADTYDPCDRCSRNICYGCEHCEE